MKRNLLFELSLEVAEVCSRGGKIVVKARTGLLHSLLDGLSEETEVVGEPRELILRLQGFRGL